MKRRLSILLIVTMLAAIMLGGCGKSPKDVNVAATTEENAKESENTTDEVAASDLNEEASDGATDIGTAALHEISVKEKWEGTWYGFMSCEGSTGIYEPYNGDIYGCYMVVEFDSDTTG